MASRSTRPASHGAGKGKANVTTQTEIPNTEVYMINGSKYHCGALIAFGSSGIATLGGTLSINGTLYGITAQHARFKIEEADTESDSDDSDLEEGKLIDESDLYKKTDKGKKSSTRSRKSTTKPASIVNKPVEDFTQSLSSDQKIGRIAGGSERVELDYEVFKLDPHRFKGPNKVNNIIPRKVIEKPTDRTVWAATANSGCVRGEMTRVPSFMRMAGARTFQEAWCVDLDRETRNGDGGAWVVDEDGNLYGHIIAAGGPSKQVFIMPAHKIFEDIKKRFGHSPRFPTK
ncbi:hypothetical protein ACLMJK_004344 [Lecanora helva]